MFGRYVMRNPGRFSKAGYFHRNESVSYDAGPRESVLFMRVFVTDSGNLIVDIVSWKSVVQYYTTPTDPNLIKGGNGMKATYSKWFIILCAGLLVLGLGACNQNQEPTEEEEVVVVVEVELDQGEAHAAQDTAKDMTDETVRRSVEESGNTATEMEETVEETVDTVDDTASPAPDSMPEDGGQDSG
jgi:hypothetical protein